MDLDTQTALGRLGNNKKLYGKILDRFLNDNAGADVESAGLVAAGDMADLERFAHTLKGLAGTIGGDALQKSALALEQAAKNASGPELDVAQEAFAKDLAATMDAVRGYLAQNPL